ncbi:leucine-rich repeat domain-containing protein [Magnetospirillum sulfuroxidans]|uniref:Leucine-rich repeat domain-containing protein n=1 Tax=Magnetospirillum sulfuroxidans TaxID=611300 RepID=A0ABS5IDY4_9PROT|nr:leucine-rich repeat domain-containing protein [Magnetospirillum sulfuroxidans]MBR9972624.1 leucine-rich repeat domain-containing protein [Magnetospirillum sulfuroxidans]
MAWKLKKTIPLEPASVTDLIDGDLDAVTELDLKANGLRRLPDDLGRLHNLGVLDVGANKLTVLPDSLGDLSQLRDLKAYGNKLAALPPSIGHCVHLRSLDVYRNPLQTLPAQLAQLTRLEFLDFARTEISRLPPGLEKLPIRRLALSRRPDNADRTFAHWPVDDLTFRRSSAADIAATVALLPAVIQLHLFYNDLSTWPVALNQLDLVGLTIWGEEALGFPDLRVFPKLRSARLVDCKIDAIPAWVGALTALTELDLRRNQITILPRQLADLGDDLDLDLGSNPLTPPLDELAQQGTPALFAYLRTLADDSAPDPAQTAKTVPEQQVAPLVTQVVEGRLVVAPAVSPLEAEQPQLQAMHGETLDWAQQTLERTGNHPLLSRMVQRCVSLLGERVQALQVLPLAFANDRLRLVLDDYAQGNDDPLSAEQRGMCNALIGNIHMLLNWTQEWQEYKRKSNDPVAAEAAGQVQAMLKTLATALEPYRQAVDPALPPVINDLAEAARPGQKAEMVHGAMDGLNNVLAPLARQGLLTLTDKDKEEIRKTVVQHYTKRVLLLGDSLALVGCYFLLSHAPDLMALAQVLPLDYGWLRQVIAALRGMISG